MDDALLEVRDLKTWFYTDDGIVRGCDGVSWRVREGETLAVVGESGAGKSVAAMSILNLIPFPPGKIVGGEILFEKQNLVGISPKRMNAIRGNKIAMIFQEPMTSLNPVKKVGWQIRESILLHRICGKREALERSVELLDMVGIPDADKRVDDYPHQMSGGMRQRVMIAIALACNPKLLIADEPTSALDVSIQLQILELCKKLQRRLGMAMILITHDMSVVAEVADSVAVMYAGKIVEYGPAERIFYESAHPYLNGLKKCIPRLDAEQKELFVIDGIVPDPLNLPQGCKFEPRCPQTMPLCREDAPPRQILEGEHYVCCWLFGGRKSYA